jgi:hypothetical protein
MNLQNDVSKLQLPSEGGGIMGISVTDMMVHVQESVSPEKMQNLEAVVRGDVCVISACTSAENPHLLMVTYNPECTTSGKLLEIVRGQGVHADLIGL